MFRLAPFLALLVLLPNAALAQESSVTAFESYIGGVTHTMFGLDHVIAMIAVGLYEEALAVAPTRLKAHALRTQGYSKLGPMPRSRRELTFNQARYLTGLEAKAEAEAMAKRSASAVGFFHETFGPLPTPGLTVVQLREPHPSSGGHPSAPGLVALGQRQLYFHGEPAYRAQLYLTREISTQVARQLWWGDDPWSRALAAGLGRWAMEKQHAGEPGLARVLQADLTFSLRVAQEEAAAQVGALVVGNLRAALGDEGATKVFREALAEGAPTPTTALADGVGPGLAAAFDQDPRLLRPMGKATVTWSQGAEEGLSVSLSQEGAGPSLGVALALVLADGSMEEVFVPFSEGPVLVRASGAVTEVLALPYRSGLIGRISVEAGE